jgi:hypothetical protein
MDPLSTRILRNSEMVRGLSAFLLILSLFTQSLIPSGWMPGNGSVDGRAGLVICYGGDPHALVFGNEDQTAVNGGSGSQHKNDQDHHPDQTCPFAGAAHVANVTSTVPQVIPFAFVSQRISFATDETSAFIAYAGPPLGSRAPPTPLV